MPVLVLGGEHWEDRLLALMCEPDDAEARALNFAYRLHREMGAAAPRECLDLLVGRDLRQLHRRLVTGERHGQHAGDLLIRVQFLADHRPRHASLEKAIRLYLREQHGRRDNLGGEMPTNRSTLSKAWATYRTVAPLWAAMMRARRNGVTEPLLPELLAVSEFYRCFGERHRSPIGATGSRQAQRTLLDPAQTWRPPATIALPPLLHGFETSLAPGPWFDDWMDSTPA